MSSSPGARKAAPPRPKIQLPLPGQYYPQTGMGYVSTPYGQTPIPMTPVSGPPQMVYSNRASEFVFSQFKGIKDLTKSGLSVGEKSAFWLYEKVSSWSKRWFTHIFLFVIVLLYSIGGAMIFVTIEGSYEDVVSGNIRRERNETVKTIRGLCEDEVLASNLDQWIGKASNEVVKYEKYLYEFFKRDLSDHGQKMWTFWNAVFYCGTIYTTIGAEHTGPLNGLQCPQGRHRVARAAVSGHRVARDSRGRHRSISAAAKPSGSSGSGHAGGGGSSLCFISVPVSICTGGPRRTADRASFQQFVFVPRSTRTETSSAMEDSYTVHRRRKAAARRREKTPDPSVRNQQLVETSEDEGESRRARMEQMAEDAERAEIEEREKRVMQGEEPSKAEERTKRSPSKFGEVDNASTMTNDQKRSPLKELQTCDNDAEGETAARSVKKELVAKVDNGSPVKDVSKSDEAIVVKEAAKEVTPKEKYEDAIPKSKEVDADIDQRVEPRKVERRLKKKSRERVERHGQSTDSSDMEEVERHSRRTKSPEGSKLRTRKSASRKTSSGDFDAATKDVVEKPPREKRSSKPKLEELEFHPKPERRARKYSLTDDAEEDHKMKKSESFPRQTAEVVAMRRSSSDVKKQIIPLSNDSLIQDFAKAQMEYLKREQNILDPDTPDVFEDAENGMILRRRKFSTILTESEEDVVEKAIEEIKAPEVKKSWLSWLPFPSKQKKDEEPEERKDQEEPSKPKPAKETEVKCLQEVQLNELKKVTFMDFLRALKDVVVELKAFMAQNPREMKILRGMRNRCMSELMLVIIYCGLGAFVFRYTEGAFETFYKCGVKRVKRDFLDSLWNYSHNLREDDWKSMARRKLMEFEEQLHTAHEAGVHTYSGQRSWTFLNAIVYCLTVITTIGYGHISPSTNTGRAITIVYAIFGIPIFLIILADFGKLFTRIIKFLWAFVRRLYYTGSCRKVRRTGPVQEVMKGVQLVYDLATFKRPSQINPEDIEEMQKQTQQSQTVLNLDGNAPETPATPAMSTFAIDDEFNLPISVAIFILLGYIFIGATLFCLSEGWGFFESFYFVFISMSTIGFGDYVPKHPVYMMCSIIYLVFGLALTSMCINVVQVMLSDSFRQASQKIGATIGFVIAEEDRSVNPATPPPVEVADVHTVIKESNSEEKIAPKAKQEDVDL